MQAEIITIGDEILIGQVVDTNSAFIGEAFNKIGLSIYQITSVQDDGQHILKALQQAKKNADVIIITGGLGPTKDDITKHTLCEYFDDTLVENQTVLNHIEHLFSTYIKAPVNDLNRQQALVPSKATVLQNDFGTAPGMWFEKDNTVFVSLPGVPYEMKALIEKEVIPRLKAQFKFPYIKHKTLLTYGVGESNLAERIEAWENALPEFISLAYLPNFGLLRLRLSAKAMDKDRVDAELEKQIQLLLPQIEDVFIGFEDEGTFEVVIGKLLVERNQTIATAESCTGGNIAKTFTTNSGASQYFKGSVVAYATEIKTKVLNVSEDLIKEHSVVSIEVAEDMARNVRQLYNSDYGISTTGNAGPTKGDSDVEVGTVCIAIATKDKVVSEVFNFGKSRERVINKATQKALEMLKKEILKK